MFEKECILLWQNVFYNILDLFPKENPRVLFTHVLLIRRYRWNQEQFFEARQDKENPNRHKDNFLWYSILPYQNIFAAKKNVEGEFYFGLEEEMGNNCLMFRHQKGCS